MPPERADALTALRVALAILIDRMRAAAEATTDPARAETYRVCAASIEAALRGEEGPI